MNSLSTALLLVCLSTGALAQPAPERSGRYMLKKCETVQAFMRDVEGARRLPPDAKNVPWQHVGRFDVVGTIEP